MSKVYVGDAGTAIDLDVEEDLAGATVVTIEARKPSGATATWTSSVIDSTKIRYVTTPSTFDQAGLWQLQAKVVLPSGTWLGEVVNLRIYAAFE